MPAAGIFRNGAGNTDGDGIPAHHEVLHTLISWLMHPRASPDNTLAHHDARAAAEANLEGTGNVLSRRGEIAEDVGILQNRF